MTEKKKTTSKKVTVAAVIGWIAAALSLAFAMAQGGTAEIKVPCMDGGECLIIYEQTEGILNLAKDCKNFENLGDRCEGSLKVTTIYTKLGNKPAVVPEEEPAPEPEEVKPDAEDITDADQVIPEVKKEEATNEES